MHVQLSNLASIAVLSLFASAANQQAAQAELLLDSTLRMLSFAGAIGGGFMALAFFPTKKKEVGAATLREDAIRWVACSLFGGSFAPIVSEFFLPKYGLPLTTSTALATSAFLGMFAWLLVAIIHRIIKSKFPSD